LIDGYIFGSRFTMGANAGMLRYLYFYHEHTGIPNNYARPAIYTVSGDRPGTLIKQGNLTLLTKGWVELTFPITTRLDPGTEYFLLVWINESTTGISTVRYSLPGGAQGFTRNMGAGPVGNFPATMVGGAVRGYRFTMYATYDVVLGTVTENLKAIFHVGQGFRDLKAIFRTTQEILFAQFRLRQEIYDLHAKATVRHTATQDLKAIFSVVHTGTVSLFSKLTVKKVSIANLFAKMHVIRVHVDLHAEFIVRGINILEIPAEVIIRHTESLDLKTEFVVRYSAIKDLLGKTTIRHSATGDLYASFWVGGSADLKAIFYLPTRRNKDAYYPVILDDIDWWLNHLSLDGRGFIGWPVFKKDAVDKREGKNSLKITSDEVPKGFKEVTFGWLYEPVELTYWQPPPCVLGLDFDLLVREDWSGYEEATIDYNAIEKDNTLMCEYHEHFGAGGLTDVLDNHGAAEWLGLSSFEGWLAGEIPSYRHQWWVTIAMKWTFDGFAGIDLNRFAWARCEMYRYSDTGTIRGGPIRIYRMPDCQYIEERGSPVVMGGCNTGNHSSTGIGLEGTWTELSSDYQKMGYSEIDHSFNRHYGNLSFYADPSDGIGFSWENADWDKIDLSTLMLGWLNGTYNNHGMFLHMDYDIVNFVPYSYYNFLDYLLYYSRHSPNANKPIIRIMLQPLDQKWLFQNQRKWSINTVDPYSGSACLRLKDWSKKSYTDIGTEHGGRPGFSLKNETPAEGYIDTAFRLNNATVKRVDQHTDHTVVDWWVYQEGTPRDNYFNVYFRYQDESNHYRVVFNKKGTNCRIEREVNGVSKTLNTFNGNFNVGVWNKIRVTFAKINAKNFKICCYKWNEYSNIWTYLAGAIELTEYWPSGGTVQFEGLDCDVDETDIWETISRPPPLYIYNQRKDLFCQFRVAELIEGEQDLKAVFEVRPILRGRLLGNTNYPYYYNGVKYVFWEFNAYQPYYSDTFYWLQDVRIDQKGNIPRPGYRILLVSGNLIGAGNSFGLGDKIFGTYYESDSDVPRTRIGSIGVDGSIAWANFGSVTSIWSGYGDTSSIGWMETGERRWICNFSYTEIDGPGDTVWVRTDDVTWTRYVKCASASTKYRLMPLGNGYGLKIVEAYLTPTNPTILRVIDRDLETGDCGTSNILSNNAEEETVSLASDTSNNLIHIVFLDKDTGALEHYSMPKASPGIWNYRGKIKDMLSSETCVGISFDSTTERLYILYSIGNKIYRKYWGFGGYSSEKLIYTERSEISDLSVHPNSLEGKIVYAWQFDYPPEPEFWYRLGRYGVADQYPYYDPLKAVWVETLDISGDGP